PPNSVLGARPTILACGAKLPLPEGEVRHCALRDWLLQWKPILEGIECPQIAARSSLQASSHRRHASKQTRQCACLRACRSHSSPQTLQAPAHASSSGLVTSGSYSACRLMTLRVASHTSAQFKHRRMHLTSPARCCSLKSASASAVHASKQSL